MLFAAYHTTAGKGNLIALRTAMRPRYYHLRHAKEGQHTRSLGRALESGLMEAFVYDCYIAVWEDLRSETRKRTGEAAVGGKKRRPGTAVEASRAAEAALVANYVPG
ncbi:unnamed protein product [Ectocarpus sp. CCAP 1310/34]|nr:unnamed protein product [Ectocarpus sp. CCAP 1310/34]